MRAQNDSDAIFSQLKQSLAAHLEQSASIARWLTDKCAVFVFAVDTTFLVSRKRHLDIHCVVLHVHSTHASFRSLSDRRSATQHRVGTSHTRSNITPHSACSLANGAAT
ncbi:hypothetical protein BV22DRAFT_308603 [Leucogyrophana mollusca]|uniref:Uncharacterized protein n=1 Tax=Leucogyrophana mollusca TaxID=85980 RepID=A0ACB8BM56_9AGAM|nr:hypothetical protein BV22DRAFT_308603 [Leucogyrophana mollusca]